MFERSGELAIELGLVKGKAEQIIDSTPMLGAAVQDTVTLVCAGPASCSMLSARPTRRRPASSRRAWPFDDARPREKPAADWHDKVAREALLIEVATDAQRALRAVERDDALATDEAVGEAARLLSEIVGQEFDTGDDEHPRPRHGRQTRQIISAHGPEMRHGRKTNARRFTGYKLHAATDAHAPVLTAIAISPRQRARRPPRPNAGRATASTAAPTARDR